MKIILSANNDIEIVSSASNGFEVLEKIECNKPDIILMDIRMPKMDGVVCTKEVKDRYPDIKIIILTTFDDDEFIFSALKHGASGYLLKGVSMSELHEDITKRYKVKKNKLYTISILIILIIFFGGIYKFIFTPKKVTLTLGIQEGSSWGVPQGKENKVIDDAIRRFEKENPGIEIEYESGIRKTGKRKPRY